MPSGTLGMPGPYKTTYENYPQEAAEDVTAEANEVKYLEWI